MSTLFNITGGGSKPPVKVYCQLVEPTKSEGAFWFKTTEKVSINLIDKTDNFDPDRFNIKVSANGRFTCTLDSSILKQSIQFLYGVYKNVQDFPFDAYICTNGVWVQFATGTERALLYLGSTGIAIFDCATGEIVTTFKPSSDYNAVDYISTTAHQTGEWDDDGNYYFFTNYTASNRYAWKKLKPDGTVEVLSPAFLGYYLGGIRMSDGNIFTLYAHETTYRAAILTPNFEMLTWSDMGTTSLSVAALKYHENSGCIYFSGGSDAKYLIAYRYQKGVITTIHNSQSYTNNYGRRLTKVTENYAITSGPDSGSTNSHIFFLNHGALSSEAFRRNVTISTSGHLLGATVDADNNYLRVHNGNLYKIAFANASTILASYTGGIVHKTSYDPCVGMDAKGNYYMVTGTSDLSKFDKDLNLIWTKPGIMTYVNSQYHNFGRSSHFRKGLV